MIIVIAALHPLRQDRIRTEVAPGPTLAALVDQVLAENGRPRQPGDITAYVNGDVVPRDWWPRVKPRSGSSVVLKATAGEPVSTAIGLTALISSLGASAAVAGAIGGAIVSVAISAALNFAVNALFPARPPQMDKDARDRDEPVRGYSVSGSRNDADPFGPIPVILGRHRVAPMLGALPYTETSGDDQYVRQLFVWGYGALLIEDLKIGETPLSSFEDVEVETRQGFLSDEPVTLYPGQVYEESLSIELIADDGYHRRTTADDVDELSVDIVWPNGVFRINKETGDYEKKRVRVRARYRLVGGSSWTFMPDMEVYSNSQDTMRRSTRVKVARGQYEIEVGKTTPEYTGTDVVEETPTWVAFRGIRNEQPIAFGEQLAVTAIRIRASSQLNGVLDTLNGVVTSLARSWDGEEWTYNTPTESPADLFRHVLKGAANARPVPDSHIDYPALEAWGDYCRGQGFRFGQVRTTRGSVFEALADVCSAGRAFPVFKDGKWSVVWDQQSTPIVQHFTPRNSWGFSAQRGFRHAPHAWRVRFINEDKGWAEDERIVYDDGYDETNATRFEGIEFPGVTDPRQIWRHGRFHIAQLRLRPETYSLNVDFEHLICTRGDRVRLTHDVILVGIASGRVKSSDAVNFTVTVDEVLTFEAGKSYWLRFRLPDGEALVRSVLPGTAGELSVIPLDGGGDLPGDGDLFAFGESGSDSGIYRVQSIETQDGLVAKLTLVDDAADIYDADNGTVPEFQSNVTAPQDMFELPPTDLRATEHIYKEGTRFVAVARLTWKVPRFGQVDRFQTQYKRTDEPWRSGGTVAAPTTQIDVGPLTPEVYNFRVRCLFKDGTASCWHTLSGVRFRGLSAAPAQVENFRISVLGDVTLLSWDETRIANLSHYEIRHVPIWAETVEWNSATRLAAHATGTSIQVPTLVGTYLIKAVTAQNVKSAVAASIRTTIAALDSLNVVEVLTEHPGFAGTRDDVEVYGGILRLRSNSRMDSWSDLASVETLQLGLGDAASIGVAPLGYYEFAGLVDLGEVYTSRVTAEIDAFGENLHDRMIDWQSLADVDVLDASNPEDWDVDLEYAATDDDPAGAPIWSDWAPFNVGDFTARALKFRLRLSGREIADAEFPHAVTTPAVRALSARIDMPDRVLGEEDIVVPAAGLQVDFDPPFISLKGVAIAEQDMDTGDYSRITAKDQTGFHIRFYNAAGAGVERTFDYLAKGYGRLSA